MRHFPLMLLAAVMMTLTSCGEDSFLNRREFVDYGGKASELLLRVDWDTYADGRPTGMSLYTYNEEGDGERLVTNDVDSVPLRRPDGRYRLMLFNLSTDEFGSMNFYRMDDIDSARVMLTTVTQRANRSWDKGVVYQRDPEQLYVALDTLVFPPELMATRATDTARYVVVERPATGLQAGNTCEDREYPRHAVCGGEHQRLLCRLPPCRWCGYGLHRHASARHVEDDRRLGGSGERIYHDIHHHVRTATGKWT